MSTLLFFFNDTATTEIYTLSLHDALPISPRRRRPGRDRADAQVVEEIAQTLARVRGAGTEAGRRLVARLCVAEDRKSTRLNSSHANISYAVFCLKKKTPSS